MARPTSYADLPDHKRRGEEVVHWNANKMMVHPDLVRNLLAAAESAKLTGLVADNTGIYEALTTEQLESNLLDAQARWDELKEKYEVAVQYPPTAKNHDFYSIDNWARENGLPPIKAVIPDDGIPF